MPTTFPLEIHANCPTSGEPLRRLEPWLLGTASRDDLYPIFCKTPVIIPDPEVFLAEEVWSLARALAQFGGNEDEDARQWYFSRYGAFDIPNPTIVDSGVFGEGYPGFWDALVLPEFVKTLTRNTPEDRIAAIVGDTPKQIGLDLGCGQGGMTQRMAASCDWVFGLENHFYLAATANHLLPADSISIQYLDPASGGYRPLLPKPSVTNALVVCGDALAPPFRENTFDWIHFGHLLDLSGEPERLMENILRLLKPGGWLSICTPFDCPSAGYLDEALALLRESLVTKHQEDGLPWLRFHHKRRFVLHEDWIWIGRRQP